MLYDKTGAAFEFDHEHGDAVYVRPMVRVVTQSTSYSGDDFHEEEGLEPASFLVMRQRGDLYDAPPVADLNAEIEAKQQELRDLATKAKNDQVEAERELRRTELELAAAKRDLDAWMAKHKVMIDLGKLLDGKTLYPLTVSESHYHKGPDIPRIPNMRSAGYLQLTHGDWEVGKAWSCKKYSSDSYGSQFQFFDSEVERSEIIASEFALACEAFRKSPDFSESGKTYSTRLDFGRLQKWCETHPALSIPEDIVAMKAADDAKKIEARKAALAEEMAALGERT